MDKSLSVIPELFYDLIGRVFPGALVLVAAAAAWLGPARMFEGMPAWIERASGSLWPYALLFLLLSYLAAVVLGTLWDRTLGRKQKDDPASQEWARRLYELMTRDPQNRPFGWCERGMLERLVGICQPQQEYRLQKLGAEQSFCKVVASGFTLVLVLAMTSNRWALFWKLSYESAYLTAGMILSVLGCFLWMKDLKKTHDADLCNLACLIELLPDLRGGDKEGRQAA